MRVRARFLADLSCAVALSILVACPTHGQDSKSSARPDRETASEGTTSESTAPKQVNIFYTSQLFGYFREPDLQPRMSQAQGCAAWADERYLKEHPEASQSPAARVFHELWGRLNDPGKILVGTGDNLSPVLWARQFDPTSSWGDPEVKGNRTGKELFTWDPGNRNWVRDEDLDPKKYEPLLDRLKHGEGTIPTDNAGCFLRHAGYAAIVPGKYDFYFGPDRLRLLARFLASKKEGDFRPVQMLGANLVIETTWKNDHKPVGDIEDPPRFAPWSNAKFTVPKQSIEHGPTAGHQSEDGSGTEKPPEVPAVIVPQDGGQVYPWFPGAELKLMDLSHARQLLKALTGC